MSTEYQQAQMSERKTMKRNDTAWFSSRDTEMLRRRGNLVEVAPQLFGPDSLEELAAACFEAAAELRAAAGELKGAT